MEPTSSNNPSDAPSAPASASVAITTTTTTTAGAASSAPASGSLRAINDPNAHTSADTNANGSARALNVPRTGSFHPHFVAPLDKELSSKPLRKVVSLPYHQHHPNNNHNDQEHQQEEEGTTQESHANAFKRSPSARRRYGSKRSLRAKSSHQLKDLESGELQATTSSSHAGTEASAPAISGLSSRNKNPPEVAVAITAAIAESDEVRDDKPMGDPASPNAEALSSRMHKKESSRLAREFRLDSPNDGANAPAAIITTGPSANATSDKIGKATKEPARKGKSRFRISRLERRSSALAAQMLAFLYKCSYLSKVFRGMTTQQVIAYALIVFGVLSECTVPSPRYNVPIGVVVLLFSNFHHRLIVVGMISSTLIDLFWMLRGPQDSYNGLFAPALEFFMRFWLLLCMLCKVSLVFGIYYNLDPEKADDDEEVPEGGSVWWDRVKYFFPRKTLPRRSFLSFEVLMRVLSLIWLHGIGGILFLVVGVIGAAGFDGKAAFQCVTFGIPLHLMTILKGMTALACYMMASTRVSYYGCCKLTGCDRLADYVEDPEQASDIVVNYDRQWIGRLQKVKSVDAIAGVYLMFTLFASFHANANSDISDPTTTVLLVITLVLWLLMDVWCTLLIVVAARCGVVLHYHHDAGTSQVDAYYPNQLEYEEEDEANSDDDEDDHDDEQEEGRKDQPDGTVAPKDGAQSLSRRSMQAIGKSKQIGTRGPSLLKQSSRIIVNDGDPIPRDVGSKAVWIRHVDPDTKRTFLVHSVTGEKVWEIVAGAADADADVEFSEQEANEEGYEIDVNGEDTPSSAPVTQKQKEYAQFVAQWDELAEDAGSFTCRVTKIPDVETLANHLETQDFVVITDGSDRLHGAVDGNKRTVQFVDTSGVFFAMLVFYQLQLKLVARFRCGDPQVIVDFVRRLRLKDVVGSYTTCDDD